MDPQVLLNKSIVIIGGTAGLGLSAALACQKSGARLVVAGRNDEFAAQAAAKLGDDVPLILGNASEPHLAEATIAAAVKHFGRLDGLYHVAGASGRRWGDGPLDALEDEAWRKTFAANLDAVFYSNRAAARQFMRQACGGSVLNLSSVLAQSPAPGHFATHAYAAAKAGLIGLTRSAAAYYGPQKIRFNAIAAGLIESPMSARAKNDATVLHYLKTKQPLAEAGLGLPTDLDAAIVYFLSDGSRLVTGQVLEIDAGWSVSEGQL